MVYTEHSIDTSKSLLSLWKDYVLPLGQKDLDQFNATYFVIDWDFKNYYNNNDNNIVKNQ